MTRPIHVLHVEDDPGVAEPITTSLEAADERISVHSAPSVEAGHTALAEGDIDCIVADYRLPDRTGIEFLDDVREAHPHLPFILFTRKGSESLAGEAISMGVTDYVRKGGKTDACGVLANRVVNAVERRRAEAGLRDSRERLDLFFEQSPLGVIRWDDEFTIARVNDTAAGILGYTPDELVGAPWEILVPEERRDAIGECIASDLLEGAGGYHTVTEIVRKGGEHITCEWHNHVVTDATGAVVAVYSQFWDITERRDRMRALERERNRFEAVFETVPEPAVHVVFEDTEPIVQHVNHAFESMFGYGTDEAAGESVDDLLVSDGHRTDADEINQLVQETGLFQAEVYRETVAGERPFLFTAQTMEVEEGDESRIEGVATYVDLTDQRRRESELARQNRRLEEFASIVSHDLRNPLSVASGRLDLVREERDSDHLAAIADAHDRMEALIEDLLALARQGATATDLEAVPLPEFLAACWETVETVDATLAVRTERTIQADEVRASQLFANLFRNAVEHGGDDVAVTVGDLETGFFVQDDGPGIPAEEREAVFDAGYSTREAGTGFGLNIVKEIVDAHEWAMEVTERDGGGARFEVTGVEFAE